MKKVTAASMIVASCLLFSACSSGNSQQGNNYADPYKNTEQTATADQSIGQPDWQLKQLKYSAEVASKLATQTAKEKAKKVEETFFGNWIVKRDIKTSSVSAYGQREIDKMMSKKIAFSKDLVKFDTITCPNPKFTKTEYTEETFKKANGMSLKELGINDKKATMVDVYDKNGQYWSASPASHFIVKNKDTLILADQGQYFEVIRVK
ncbi:MAG: hypothetical protein HY779_04070 [Rubrobacteridae bacterium]|nr:hypothetical protein [Rubrobacteridae bacterium]